MRCGIPSRPVEPLRPRHGTEKSSCPDTMTPAAMAALVDAAFRCPHTLVFLDTVVATFKMVGRDDDATATAWIAHLYACEEIEVLLRLRAAWRRGFTRNPADAVRRVAAAHR